MEHTMDAFLSPVARALRGMLPLRLDSEEYRRLRLRGYNRATVRDAAEDLCLFAECEEIVDGTGIIVLRYKLR